MKHQSKYNGVRRMRHACTKTQGYLVSADGDDEIERDKLNKRNNDKYLTLI